MHATILLALWGLAALAIWKVASMIVAKRQHAARAKELGCQEAPEYPNQGILGWNQIKDMQAADKGQRFPDLMIERQARMSAIHGRECSTFKFHLLGQELYFTSDPKNIQALLATKFDDYYLGPSRRGNMIVTLGDGIFVQDGKQWEHSRAMLRPNFVRDQVSDLDLEEHHVQDLLRVMPVQSNGWTDETDIQKLFFRLTIDSACEFLFGESLDTQMKEAGLAPRDEATHVDFAKHFDNATLHLAKRFRFGDNYWLHNPKEFKEDNKLVNQFMAHYVDLALKKGTTAEKKAEEGHGKEKYVFLEALAQQTQDPVELRAQMLNILLAGRDTTASLLSWLFHELLRNPEVFTKLRQTILDTFGTYDDPHDISFATLKGCQYLQYCLNETLRVWPTVPGNGRRSNKPTVLPRGGGPDGESPIYIKKDVEINYAVHVMHRRKDIWGEDANEFKPERFASRRPGWEYLPFNGGPRICIGQQFALTEASYVVVRLLQKFDKIEPGKHELEGEYVRSNLSLTNAPGKPVTLYMHEAKQ
ncbi:hypothetical protein LTR37_021441 [Vermiconidia calcicola]|uniref:Uncharacterized protein n=1 Tax=Vermiconidia calcicola TaxID=1690605 RepID=A0ACC3M8R4_9PEZI|nr:hypothetical protein LTR37_021441 [Vermiconidia calcicola]